MYTLHVGTTRGGVLEAVWCIHVSALQGATLWAPGKRTNRLSGALCTAVMEMGLLLRSTLA